MMVKIIPYHKSHHPAFKALNLLWLEKYNLKESHDLLILNDPEATILNRGGFIWVAMDGDEVVGTVALIKEHYGIYELAKMGVAESHQGNGISKMLIETALQKARTLSLKSVTLFSNHQLQTAIRLYEKYGFKHVALEGSPFETADVKMELVL